MKKVEKLTLSQWRGVRSMSKAELSRKTGITERTILSYETNISSLRKANYSRIERMASALSVSVNDIFLSPNSEKTKYGLSNKKSNSLRSEHK